jgi:hypothetical protein
MAFYGREIVAYDPSSERPLPTMTWKVRSVGGLMNNSREIAATIVGAAIGGVAGYLFLTERGRSVCRQIESTLEGFSREVISFRDTVQKGAGVVNEGWTLLNDTLGERGKPPARYPSGQTAPFGGHHHVR